MIFSRGTHYIMPPNIIPTLILVLTAGFGKQFCARDSAWSTGVTSPQNAYKPRRLANAFSLDAPFG